MLLFALALGLALPLVADQNPPVLFFGGHKLHIGMTKQAALAQLADCCELSPPGEANIEDKPHPPGVLPGHFILAKAGPTRMLGSISFFQGKVIRLSRPLDDEIDTYSDRFGRLCESASQCTGPKYIGDEQNGCRFRGT